MANHYALERTTAAAGQKSGLATISRFLVLALAQQAISMAGGMAAPTTAVAEILLTPQAAQAQNISGFSSITGDRQATLTWETGKKVDQATGNREHIQGLTRGQLEQNNSTLPQISCTEGTVAGRCSSLWSGTAGSNSLQSEVLLAEQSVVLEEEEKKKGKSSPEMWESYIESLRKNLSSGPEVSDPGQEESGEPPSLRLPRYILVRLFEKLINNIPHRLIGELIEQAFQELPKHLPASSLRRVVIFLSKIILPFFALACVILNAARQKIKRKKVKEEDIDRFNS